MIKTVVEATLEMSKKELMVIIDQLNSEVSLLQEYIENLKRKKFGRSKESLSKNNGQISLFEFLDQEEVASLNLTEDDKVAPEEVVVKEHKRQVRKKEDVLADLPAQYVDHELSKEEQVCDQCGSQMTDLGSVDVRSEIEFLQAKLHKLIHRQHSYVCKKCERESVTSIKKSPVPRPLINHSFGSPTIVTETIIQKFQQKVPAYRQEKIWKNLGLPLSRDNICRWHISITQNVLEPLFELLHQKLLNQKVLHADETSYRVIESKKYKTYFWMFASGKCEKNQIVLYLHDESRKAVIPQKFLSGFQGWLHCDGYQAYPLIENISIMNCGAHVRRKFYEALPNQKNPNKESAAYIGVKYWDELFKIERSLKDKSCEERFLERNQELKPILDNFYQWLDSLLTALPNSKLGKAISYAQKMRPGIMNILSCGDLELSNNRAERLIKELVIGRKNWLFSTSLEGARSAGIILSIMKTAELNNLDIRKYFIYLFQKIPNLPVLVPEALEDYLPWSEKVKQACHL